MRRTPQYFADALGSSTPISSPAFSKCSGPIILPQNTGRYWTKSELYVPTQHCAEIKRDPDQSLQKPLENAQLLCEM
jgi:hypothetical protein